MAMLGVLIGSALSVAAALLLARSFSIPEIGVLPFAVSAIVVASVAMAASFFPAWRVTLLSPMSAIRNEPQSAWQAVREKIGRARAKTPGEQGHKPGRLVPRASQGRR
jgi:hypothetical protein